MIGIDLFSGAGGMSLGARNAGINVILAVESDYNAVMTYRKNYVPQMGIQHIDIRNFNPNEFKINKKPLIVFGGPPCQGFSSANQRTRSLTNEDNWLYKEFIRVVKEYKADWFVLENVKGIKETEGGIFVSNIIKEFKQIGYTISTCLLCSSDYGVPQNRKRFFFIGSLHGIKFNFSEIKKENQITVRDAISDLPFLTNGASISYKLYEKEPTSNYATEMRKGQDGCMNNIVTKNSELVLERYKYIPQGGNWENIPNHLLNNYKNVNRCHSGIYKRLKFDEPSLVIGNFRKNMLIHPENDRGLSVREAARLQSFPDDYIFVGSIGFQQQQVANAVPPKLSEKIFKQIVNYS